VEVTVEGALSSNALEGLMTILMKGLMKGLMTGLMKGLMKGLMTRLMKGLMKGLMTGLIILMTGDENECRRKKQVMLLRE
jgi:hypothetical protein